MYYWQMMHRNHVRMVEITTELGPANSCYHKTTSRKIDQGGWYGNVLKAGAFL